MDAGGASVTATVGYFRHRAEQGTENSLKTGLCNGNFEASATGISVIGKLKRSFTQPNAAVCQKMLEWACGAAEGLDGDLLELYCGNGNFTLPLSEKFERVLATEISKTSVSAAQWNIEANRIGNIKIARLSAEEFTEAYTGKREFKRLKDGGIALTDYAFSTIFVDPPRLKYR